MTFTPASYPEGNQAGLDTEPGFSIAAWQQRPESLGWVNVKSSDPFEKPIIQPNYLSAPEDQRVAVEGISCLLYTSPSPRDLSTSRMPSSA